MTTTSTSPRGGGPILGRERELARLDSLVDGLPKQGAALIVRGEPGIGKSVLLSAASRRAQEAGMRVLGVTGVQSEAELPFAGLHQLLLPLLDGAERLPAPQRAALLAAFGMAETAEAPDRFMIGLAVLELLSDAAERALVLVVADDAQWLDPSTAALLGFVSRRIEHEPIGMLVAVRVGEADPFADASLPEMALGGLEEDAAGALLATQEYDLSPGVQQRLLTEASGNPLALVELPARLSRDELEGRVPLPVALPLTTRLERAFATQVGTLPAATQALLLIASADNGGGALEEILMAAEVTGDDRPAAEDLAPAVSARLVEVDEGRVAFRHPLVRSAIYQTATLANRRSAHEALAEILYGQADRQVWHRAAALVGPDEGVAEALENAAERARRRGAIGTAIRTLERSVGLSEDRSHRGRRLLQAAELAFETGRRDLARRLLTEVQRHDLSANERQRIFFMRHWFEDEKPISDTDVDGVAEAAERAGRDGDGTTATNLLLFAAVTALGASASAEVRERIVRASAKLGVGHNDPRLVAIRALATPERGGAEVIATLSKMPPDGGGDPETARLLGFAATAIGEFDLATSFLSASVDALRAHGRIAVLASALILRAHANLGRDRWALVSSDVDEARRLSEETNQQGWAAGAMVYECRLMAMRGEMEQVEALAEAVEHIALPLGVRTHLTHVQWARGLAALGDGRHEDAYENLARAFRPEDPAYHYSARLFMLGDLAEAARGTGRSEEVCGLIAEAEAAIAGIASPGVRVAVTHARTMLAGEDEAEAAFERALEAVPVHRPFVRARLQLAYGAWLRRERRVVESRAPLRASRETFDALGAAAWAERARKELRASGIESRPRERSAAEDLTPQELQIASLAASGLSNREIGQRLFLSHRTVGAHLYRAFPKLGVTSRGQLRSVLDSPLR